METLKAMLPKAGRPGPRLAFLVVAVASAPIAWKIVGIWQGTWAVPRVRQRHRRRRLALEPVVYYLLTCVLCVLGALPMLPDRATSACRAGRRARAYPILSLYLLYAIFQVVFASFSQGM